MKERFSDTEPKPQFAVDKQGAYLTELYDRTGKAVLFPRTDLEGKTRGGCHVCLPNFGPDASGRLAQHGFGRTLDWKSAASEEPGVADLYLPAGTDEYAGLKAALHIAVGDEGGDHLTMRLDVGNHGAEPLRVAPGFHPYFAVSEGDSVQLDGIPLDLTALADTEFVDGSSHELVIGGRRLRLHSDELQRWAVWTDQRGGYVCVEPTLAGPTFLNNEPLDTEMLAPDAVQSYEFRIHWDEVPELTSGP